MTRRVTRPLLLAASFGAIACAIAGCPSTTATSGYTPITGILIRSSDLVAGHGCGTGPGQVFRYTAVVSFALDDGGVGAPVSNPGPSGPVFATGVFDCFADAVFSNLPVSATGTQAFDIAVYAYDAATFPPQLSCSAPLINTPPSQANPVPCPAQDPTTVTGLGASAPLQTRCTATQAIGATQVAACCPLAPPGVDSCADAGGDAGAGAETGPDAGSDAGVEAGADATVDAASAAASISIATQSFPLQDGGTITCGTDYAGALALYATVAADGGTTPGTNTSWLACPQSLVVTNADPTLTYDFNVMLSDADGGTIRAHTSCTATPSPGTTTAATCAPAQLGP